MASLYRIYGEIWADGTRASHETPSGFILRLLLFFVATRDGISSLVNFKERGAVQVATSKGEAHCPRPDFLTPTLSYL